MIGFIRGEIADLTEEYVVLETAGVGYNIKISTNTASLLPGIGEEIKIYTYLSVHEDEMKLYGFLTKNDLDFFKLLIGVNGIGPKGALGILSAMSADDLRFAILADDAKTIARAPGIGTKTAQRVILDLKDKVDLQDAFEQKLTAGKLPESQTESGLSAAKKEAVEALTALGYSSTDSLRAVKAVELHDDMDVEDILKSALKHISFY